MAGPDPDLSDYFGQITEAMGAAIQHLHDAAADLEAIVEAFDTQVDVEIEIDDGS